ncbi:LuxR C-terminal-related transcriptional regulator [Aquibaculum arenosum]|uniref:Response regulator transcription factor n=1 Tax=Aquibaculum arenosum TaxID=3032591 RepID=A0ABT5YLQ2_9PROT|nr:response regulator transcription factor [Fodinicurvata sp. CAU 1616]MDF2095827.1 response regulator transcription factor [Fodinicurvata sp. CAU 1616]
MEHSVELLLIDRNRLLREGLKRMLSGSNVAVTEECADVAEAVQRDFSGWMPAIVLMEWVGPEAERANPVGEILTRWPGARVIVFGDSLNKSEMVMALRAGASGYLLKSMSLDALIHSLRLVLVGEVVFPTELAGQLVKEPLQSSSASFSLNHLDIDLSPREIQILRCLVAGQANKLIARELSITEGTVKVHIKRLLKKINARNRTQAAIWALNSGLQHQQPNVS